MFHIHLFVLMFTLVSAVCLAGLVAYFCLALLKSAQCREDAEDEQLWDYLLNPRTLKSRNDN
ncbi:MAG: hypothetical protein WBL50_28185 [Candidatus Acidiferrum sp.]